jgi:hypothetical protein
MKTLDLKKPKPSGCSAVTSFASFAHAAQPSASPGHLNEMKSKASGMI